MQRLTKHREARYYYRGSFERYLAEGESIATPTVRVERYEGRSWVDRSDEILETGSVAVAGDEVEFTLREADEGEQLAGQWRVVAKVTSSDQELPVGIALLTVEV